MEVYHNCRHEREYIRRITIDEQSNLGLTLHYNMWYCKNCDSYMCYERSYGWMRVYPEENR